MSLFLLFQLLISLAVVGGGGGGGSACESGEPLGAFVATQPTRQCQIESRCLAPSVEAAYQKVRLSAHGHNAQTWSVPGMAFRRASRILLA